MTNFVQIFCTMLLAHSAYSNSIIDREQKLLDTEIEIQNTHKISSLPDEKSLNGSINGQETNNSVIEAVYYNKEYTYCQLYNRTGDYCEPCFDGVSLWPRIEAGGEAIVPCSTGESIPHLPGSASRACNENGTWDNWANYSVCITLLQQHMEEQRVLEVEKKKELLILTTSVYLFLCGFIVSNIAMITAIIIFARYKHLRCLRNLIHSQLLMGMTIKNFLWIVLMFESLQPLPIFVQATRCRAFFMVYKFFLVSQYAWMFIEGLYLFIVVVNALFSNGLRFKHCLIIGWGIPVIVITGSVLTNSFLSDDRCWNVGELTPANALETISVCLLLLANCGFMTAVIYTLVRKLKNSALNESKQYRKAVRATMILVPLLGGSYIMLFYTPSATKSESAVWYYFNAVIQSTQGLVVAVVYCFLNAEVRTSIAKSHRRWKDEQTLPSSDWWSKKRRSSYFITRSKEETTETDITACQYSTGRNSRRVSEDTVSSSRRGSHVPEANIEINTSKNLRKAIALAYQQQPLIEAHTSCTHQSEQTVLSNDSKPHTSTKCLL